MHPERAMLPANGLYGHIRNNAFKSALLLFGFVVLAAVFWYAWCLVYTAVVDYWLMSHLPRKARKLVTVPDIMRSAGTLALARWWVPLVFSACWFAVAYMIHADMIRLATGARAVTRKQAPKLYNMVENLSIAAGIPMPQVQVIPTSALNAYAAGLGPNEAVVAVTRGLIETLTPDEMEAVLAHEITHIRNYDVRLMVVATVFAGGLTLIGDGVAKLFSSTSANAGDGVVAGSTLARTDGDGDGELLSVLFAVAIGIVFLATTHLFALVIKFAISRAREFMADAGAVELTKKPEALVSALMKIVGNDEIPGVRQNLRAMMISADARALFSTHPTVEARIDALRRYAGASMSAIGATPQPRRTASAASGDAAQPTPTFAASFGVRGARGSPQPAAPGFGRRRRHGLGAAT